MAEIRHPFARAQAAVEALSYAAFFLLAFVAAVAIFLQLQNQELSRAEHSFAQQIAYQFSDQIEVAFTAGPGFWQNVSLPPKLLGKPYRIVISKATDAQERETGFVYVNWQGPSRNSTFSAPTVTASYAADTGGPVFNLGESIEINPALGTNIIMANENGRIRFSSG